MASVKVAVRVRPFNQRELGMDAQLIIQMKDKTTGIVNCKARDESVRYNEFTFDYSYWSHDRTGGDFASQELVYNDLGTEVVDCAFEGYNACVFAYGQTGSGKTFTMMGSPENQGLIPRICKALFDRMAENSKRGTTHRVQVSYLEIYQERVADLLRERDVTSLKVREHPKKGPYVEGLTTCLVTNYGHIQECMNRGNSHRTTAATNMNDVSSRSHAIFTITFVQAGYCDGVPSETVSKIHLVDLAGSERADATGATGQRLKEGAHINKSLVTLGSVISSLAELSASDSSNQRKSFFIPYRDSVLTWLLKDSLGGNSKTIMIAAISPADCNYGETLSTLRYANRAKNIINKPTVNEDANVKLIRELRNEITKLKALMFSEQRSDMLAQLHEKEAREKELTEEWAEKWREAQEILSEQRALGLRKAGPGVVLDSDMPHLVAIDDDPLSTGVTLYHLREGETTIGTEDANVKQDIELRGAGLEPKHCTILLDKGVATIVPHQGANVMLNNQMIDAPTRLSQGCIIFIGKAHVFRFNDPVEAAELRKGEKAHNLSRLSILSWSTPDLALSIENLQAQEDEREDFETQRLNLEKKRELFEKEQEAFERKRKTLEEAQAKLEAEKAVMQEEHAQQTRQLQEDWRHLAVQQNERELQLKKRESDLIFQREQLEEERRKICGEISRELDLLQEFKSHFVLKLSNACQFIASHTNDFMILPSQISNIQTLHEKSKHTPLSEVESDMIIEVLNTIRGPSMLQDLVNQHRKELAELQEELDRRVDTLSERRKTVAMLDKKLVDLVEEQSSLKTTNESDYFENLKQLLASRTREELETIEKRKQGLKLNLKKINSSESPDSCETNYTSSLERNSTNNTLSSDTYHTAVCSPQIPNSNLEYLMSDSGVELKPSPRIHDESDLSSTEDYKVLSDSQSTSSVENRSPTIRKKRRESEALRRLSQRIIQQKQIILRNLDLGCSKIQLDSQIRSLQELQKQYMLMKFGNTSVLSPAVHHPLQDADSASPSPVRPLYSGSTSNLYTNSPQIHNRLAQSFHRSMPSIVTETENDSIITILSYCIRGAGTKTHYEYEIRICTCDDRWTILRRYSRFRDLHIAMKARYGDKVASIPFPSKQFFANSETVAKSRKKQLEFYLNRLIETCRNNPSCPLAYSGPVTKTALINFSPFFRKGFFENGKHGTS